ncbi:hypothetical protein ETAA8_37920 [Anatilimnocola aggregata]|uniref:Uncharacterized protein n=1 Tax=Anatilimnocola aggregata TaxID=2528021 RepID=A0A517YEP6_9BACT|nr:hypothetical protein ETAA8_37920 [Anatilimnocola aggregata]
MPYHVEVRKSGCRFKKLGYFRYYFWPADTSTHKDLRRLAAKVENVVAFGMVRRSSAVLLIPAFELRFEHGIHWLGGECRWKTTTSQTRW